MRTGALELLPKHEALLRASGIATVIAAARGYRSVTTRAELRRLGFSDPQCRVPALLIPVWDVIGQIATYQIRPDEPRIVNGKPVKYETPRGSRMVLDLHPSIGNKRGDPSMPLFLTEGIRKGDSAVSRGLCCVSVLGVWSWRGRNEHGGKVGLAEWEHIALNGRQTYIVFDSDVMVRPQVYAALVRLKAFLELRDARVRMIYLPPGEGGAKVGLDDFFAAGHSVEELLALASEEVRPPPDAQDTPTSMLYLVEGGRLCRRRQTKDTTVIEPLCNFAAHVEEELVMDDGAEPTSMFLLAGGLDTGEGLPPVRVPASRFAGMTWVAESWGLRAVVRAGQATRDYLREAIQVLSPSARRRHIFAHTGWRAVDGQLVFLTGAGAIGLESIEVDLGPELARYHLPRSPEDPREAMRRSLALLNVAGRRVTIPLLAAVYRAPLAHVLPADFSIWLEGPTGALKSTVAALFLSHYGEFDRVHLPGGWVSTANQLERRAFVLKDVLFVIDDYVTSGLDARELELKAARVLRAQGNLAGRGRLRADLTDRPAYPPRGLILATGEQCPRGQSVLARSVVVRVQRGEINLGRLTTAQEAAKRLPHAMTGYLGWLAPQMSGLAAQLQKAFAGARTRAVGAAAHLRIPESIAHLWLGLDCVLAYAVEIGGCSAAEASEHRETGWKALVEVARLQEQLVEAERPTLRFLRVILGLVAQRTAVLLDRDDDADALRPGDLLGWLDQDFVYLLPEASWHAVNRYCRDEGDPFPVHEERLRQSLAEEKLLEPHEGRLTAAIDVGGRKRRVLRLRRAAVEALLGESLTVTHRTVGTARTVSQD